MVINKQTIIFDMMNSVPYFIEMSKNETKLLIQNSLQKVSTVESV
jgi:hypothetical protein